MPSENNDVRLRGHRPRLQEAWPLGEFPNDIIKGIGKQIVHRMCVGQSDITGDDFGTIFAEAIGGNHRESPLGIADVVLEGNAWSVKTVKSSTPFTQQTVRLISGRISPDYSLGIENPHSNIADTGKAILAVWNARVNESLGEHDDLRIVVLIRNFESKQFVAFEETAQRYAATDYRWEKNKNNNFMGYEIATGEHKFTWQPHGGQFTILRHVPGCAIKFKIVRNPPMLEQVQILKQIGYTDDWIEIVAS